MTPRPIFWLALLLGLHGGLPVQAQPVAAVAPQALPAPAASAPATLALRDEALARYMVGRWHWAEPSPTMNLMMEITYADDGSFRASIRSFVRTDATKDTWAMAMQIDLRGTWVIDGDVCVETLRTSSVDMGKLPSIDRDRITAIQPDAHTMVSLASGRSMVRQRRPVAEAHHQAAAARAWPAPQADAAWQQVGADPEGTQWIDPASVVRMGDIVGLWTRSDMSAQALQSARAMGAKLPPGSRPVLAERVFLYTLIDCRRQWVKLQDIRIHMDGRQVAGSTYENDDRGQWQRIEPGDALPTAAARQLCTAPPA